jgi:hypothetical protein
MKGFKIKLPVQLGRRQTEESNPGLLEFYHNLLSLIPGKEFSNANWSLCRIDPVDSINTSFRNIISYYWKLDNKFRLIVVNFSSNSSKAHIKIDSLNYSSGTWKFEDLLNNSRYNYRGKDLEEHGLYVELDAWKGHIFNIQKIYN